MTKKAHRFKITFTIFPGSTVAAAVSELSTNIIWANVPGAVRNKVDGTKLHSWEIQVVESTMSIWRMFNRWMWKHGEETGAAKIEFFEGKKLVETATLSGLRLIELGEVSLDSDDASNHTFTVVFDPTTIIWS